MVIYLVIWLWISPDLPIFQRKSFILSSMAKQRLFPMKISIEFPE